MPITVFHVILPSPQRLCQFRSYYACSSALLEMQNVQPVEIFPSCICWTSEKYRYCVCFCRELFCSYIQKQGSVGCYLVNSKYHMPFVMFCIFCYFACFAIVLNVWTKKILVSWSPTRGYLRNWVCCLDFLCLELWGKVSHNAKNSKNLEDFSILYFKRMINGKQWEGIWIF